MRSKQTSCRPHYIAAPANRRVVILIAIILGTYAVGTPLKPSSASDTGDYACTVSPRHTPHNCKPIEEAK